MSWLASPASATVKSTRPALVLPWPSVGYEVQYVGRHSNERGFVVWPPSKLIRVQKQNAVPQISSVPTEISLPKSRNQTSKCIETRFERSWPPLRAKSGLSQLRPQRLFLYILSLPLDRRLCQSERLRIHVSSSNSLPFLLPRPLGPVRPRSLR